MNTGVEVFEPLSHNNNSFCFSSPGTLMQEMLDTLTPHQTHDTLPVTGRHWALPVLVSGS
jgi:hypothetical protein